MQDSKRQSVMVLPTKDGKILLQSFVKDGETVWDGFGNFYTAGEKPIDTAQKVIKETFKIDINKGSFKERAQLQYFINKPDGLVDLKITIYIYEIEDQKISAENVKWFLPEAIPLTQMHAATQKWLPILLDKPDLLKVTIRVEQPGVHTKGQVTEFKMVKS